MRERLDNGGLGDLVEDDPLRLRESGDFLDVPGNRFALAVGVGREVDLIGLLCGALYLLDYFALLGGNDVAWDKAALDIDGVLVALR